MDAHKLLDIANEIRSDAKQLGLLKEDSSSAYSVAVVEIEQLYDSLVSNKQLRDATRKLFVDCHYARAVEEAYKCLNNAVKQKSGLEKDGYDLMHQAFNEKAPILRLSDLRTVSQRDQQTGYRFILAGCMTGIRNPRAHEHDIRDDPVTALEMLVWANHLMSVVERAKRSRRKQNF
ncbi:MAG: TIGR02391 family protein [Chloroflexi bacterium]|nr:TIGR02391 family protein [Chloroflexota bacterium]